MAEIIRNRTRQEMWEEEYNEQKVMADAIEIIRNENAEQKAARIQKNIEYQEIMRRALQEYREAQDPRWQQYRDVVVDTGLAQTVDQT